jgi:hypothetical protein
MRGVARSMLRSRINRLHLTIDGSQPESVARGLAGPADRLHTCAPASRICVHRRMRKRCAPAPARLCAALACPPGHQAAPATGITPI